LRSEIEKGLNMSNVKVWNLAALLCTAAALSPAATVALTANSACAASNWQTLYEFPASDADGDLPTAPLVADGAGNLYGTTYLGGTDDGGVVFRLAPDGTETVLHSFTGSAGSGDGYNPLSGLVMDSAANLYGTTQQGGGTDCNDGCGIVFKVAPDGTETVLHTFSNGGLDGATPGQGVLLLTKKGDLIGTTFSGGKFHSGTVYKLLPNGHDIILYAFSGGTADGCGPEYDVISDKAGNLYGTTSSCGASGHGTIFKLAPDGAETVLYSFLGGTDGSAPDCTPILDKSGNLYGTTGDGGTYDWGTVFRLAPDGTKTVLYSFTGGGDGAVPVGGVYRTKNGDLYGAASDGGGTGCQGQGCGTIFRLAPNGTETVLHTFENQGDGAYPLAGLIQGPSAGGKQYLYGTTEGGYGISGTVFKVKE
jgi:uncharacterized repeat protein (TIGR03803 family)